MTINIILILILNTIKNLEKIKPTISNILDFGADFFPFFIGV